MAKLSEMIHAQLAALDCAQESGIESGIESRVEIDVQTAYRNLLAHLADFAVDFEQAQRLRSRRVVPLWGETGAAAKLYQWLQLGRRRPASSADGIVTPFRKATS